jgi:hypothetical protein
MLAAMIAPGSSRFPAVLVLALAAVAESTACSHTPPPNWASGGAPVALGFARWNRADATVEIHPDGKVLEDGRQTFGIDRVGRVYETDGDPIAVLQADGYLVGGDQTLFGHVGPGAASLGRSSTAWFTIGQRGEVVRYDGEGERSQDGYWQGCVGAGMRTCTLVTHMVLLREWARRPQIGVGVGIGMGFHR